MFRDNPEGQTHYDPIDAIQAIVDSHFQMQEEMRKLMEGFGYRPRDKNVIDVRKAFDEMKSESQVPMGVSAWKNHGSKFQYDLYFIEKSESDGFRKGVEAAREALPPLDDSSPNDSWDSAWAQYREQATEAISSLLGEKHDDKKL